MPHPSCCDSSVSFPSAFCLLPSVSLQARDIEDVMNLNRGNFHFLFTLAGASPFAGVMATHYYESSIDAAFWGAGSTSNAGFTWLKAFLAPNMILWEYVRHFNDTNPTITTCIGITMLLSQLAHWASLAAAAVVLCGKTPKDGAKQLLQLYLSAPLKALFTTLAFRYIMFPLTPRFLTNLLFYGGVVVGPLVQIGVLFAAIAAIAAVFGFGVGAAVGAEAGAAVPAAPLQRYRQVQAEMRAQPEPGPEPEEQDDPNDNRKRQ